MITPSEYARRKGKPYSTVMRWLQAGIVDGVETIPLPDGRNVYSVPADAPLPELKAGRRWPDKVETETPAKKAKKKGN